MIKVKARNAENFDNKLSAGNMFFFFKKKANLYMKICIKRKYKLIFFEQTLIFILCRVGSKDLPPYRIKIR